MHIAALPDDRARRTPRAGCLADDSVSLDNGGFRAQVRSAAAVLRRASVGPGDVVAVVLPNRLELVVMLFAAWRLGAAVTPVNPGLTGDEAGFQIADAGAKVVVGVAGTSDLVTLDVSELAAAQPDDADGTAPEHRDDALALLIYTSATTPRSIARALERVLVDHGGKVHTGVRVTAAAQLPPADITLLDLDPGQVVGIYGDRLPTRVRRAYQRLWRGPGAFKIDLAVQGGVPWTDEHAHRAGTVHLVGPLAEVVAAEREVSRGRLPDRPFVLVGQQYLADPGRSVGELHPVWAYAHVPHGYAGDATDAILAQLERFAPGTRERVIGLEVSRPSDFQAANPNFVGDDILTGAKTISQLVLGARPALDPYSTGLRGVYMCSAATPPGPGAHGMCGAHAAARAAPVARRRPRPVTAAIRNRRRAQIPRTDDRQMTDR